MDAFYFLFFAAEEVLFLSYRIPPTNNTASAAGK